MPAAQASYQPYEKLDKRMTYITAFYRQAGLLSSIFLSLLQRVLRIQKKKDTQRKIMRCIYFSKGHCRIL